MPVVKWRSMKIVAIANQKGGVGKTTTAVNLSAALAESGKRFLLIDLDPQANATSSFGLQGVEDISLYEPLLGEASITEKILPTRREGLFIDVEEQGRRNRSRRDVVRRIGKDQRPHSKLLLVVQYLDDVPFLAQGDRPAQNEEHAAHLVALFVDDVSCACVQLFPELGQRGARVHLRGRRAPVPGQPGRTRPIQVLDQRC